MSKANQPLTQFIDHLRMVLEPGVDETSTDFQLLDRFVRRQDEHAFAILLRRHAGMVFGICRRVLRDACDAEDAFQATFLTLAWKAGSIHEGQSVGSWLYKVAFRIALRAKSSRWRRSRHEQAAGLVPLDRPDAAPGDESHDEVGRAVAEEVQRLPEKYGAPVVLCYLQGKTNNQAAEELAVPKGTVLSRLARARERLRERLTRRGLVCGATSLAAVLARGETAPAEATIQATVHGAGRFAAGKPMADSLVSTQAVTLAKGTVFSMLCAKLKVLVLAAGALAGLAVGWVASSEPLLAGKQDRPAPTADAPPPQPKRDVEALARETQRRQSVFNLSQIGIALHAYHDDVGAFPPAAIYDKDGKPLLSWRVLLLPYIEGAGDLYKEFKLDEAWDGPNNQKLLEKMPKLFAPVRAQPKVPHSTYYRGFAGLNTIFEGKNGIDLTTIVTNNGAANTVLLVEAGEAVPWTKPDDLPCPADKPLPALGGMFEGDFSVLFADCHVQHFKKGKLKEETLRLLIDYMNNKPVELPE